MQSLHDHEPRALDAARQLNERLTELERDIRRQFEFQWYSTAILSVILMIGVMLLLVRRH